MSNTDECLSQCCCFVFSGAPSVRDVNAGTGAGGSLWFVADNVVVTGERLSNSYLKIQSLIVYVIISCCKVKTLFITTY